MTRRELARAVAKYSGGLTCKAAEQCLIGIEKAVVELLKNDEEVQLFRGLVLRKKIKKGKRYYDMNLDECLISPDKKLCEARFSKMFLDRIYKK